MDKITLIKHVIIDYRKIQDYVKKQQKMLNRLWKPLKPIHTTPYRVVM